MKFTKKDYIERLKLWEQELKTDENGMKHLAKRAIRVLKNDIKEIFK